jgi:hypothetical protein
MFKIPRGTKFEYDTTYTAPAGLPKKAIFPAPAYDVLVKAYVGLV